MRALIPILFIFAAAAANADGLPDLSVNLDSSTLSGVAGDDLMFTGTLTNNDTTTLFINSDSYTFAIGGLDDSPFLNNAPISLDAGATSSDFEIFDVNIPLGQTPDSYGGVFTVLGGTDGNALNVLGSASFTVDVEAATATPEPAPYPLFALAIALFVGARLIRKRRAA
jgi:hypothetical protein